MRLIDAEIPADDQAPSTARRLIDEATGDLGEELRERAILVVSELVTNAVRHGSVPGASVGLVADHLGINGLRIEVIDTGNPKPVVSEGIGGFGLGIVATAADDVRYDKSVGWRVVADFTAR